MNERTGPHAKGAIMHNCIHSLVAQNVVLLRAGHKDQTFLQVKFVFAACTKPHQAFTILTLFEMLYIERELIYFVYVHVSFICMFE